MADFSQNGHEPGTFEHRQKEDLGSLTDVLDTIDTIEKAEERKRKNVVGTGSSKPSLQAKTTGLLKVNAATGTGAIIPLKKGGKKMPAAPARKAGGMRGRGRPPGPAAVGNNRKPREPATKNNAPVPGQSCRPSGHAVVPSSSSSETDSSDSSASSQTFGSSSISSESSSLSSSDNTISLGSSESSYKRHKLAKRQKRKLQKSCKPHDHINSSESSDHGDDKSRKRKAVALKKNPPPPERKKRTSSSSDCSNSDDSDEIVPQKKAKMSKAKKSGTVRGTTSNGATVISLNQLFLGQCRRCFTRQRTSTEDNFKKIFRRDPSNKKLLFITVFQCRHCTKGNASMTKKMKGYIMHRHQSKSKRIDLKNCEKLLYSKTGIFLTLCNGCINQSSNKSVKKGERSLVLCHDCVEFNVSLQGIYFGAFRANDWSKKQGRK